MSISDLFSLQKNSFYKFKNSTYRERKENLLKLKKLILDNEGLIKGALYKDLGKSETEVVITETFFTLNELNHTLKNLKRLMKKRRVGTSLLSFPARSYIQPHPKGVVLIISPWNYPFQLLISPLIGALAAGNMAILKPSEVAPELSGLIADLIPRYFPEEIVAVVEGGIPETTELLNLPFNHIFYTGNIAVGKIVMERAAKNLTPVTLELGGKSPCVIWGENDFELVARRLVWGKFLNVGQTCVAPDYVIIEKENKQKLINAIEKTLEVFYPGGPSKSPDYGRMISHKHYDRVMNLIVPDEVEIGGKGIREDKYIGPTILSSSFDSPAMQEEIFGPVLPILTTDSFNEAIEYINSKPNPLASYIFSKDSFLLDDFSKKVISGGMTINDCVIHLTNPNLPFGGVGDSGIGSYHGKTSFETFTHYKSVMRRGLFLDITLRYPPYLGKSKIFRKLMSWF